MSTIAPSTNPLELLEVDDPIQVDDTGFVFSDDVGGITELHYLNSAGDKIQITSGTGLNVPAASYLNLTDTPGSFTANRVIHTNAAGDALVDSNVNILSTGELLVGTTAVLGGISGKQIFVAEGSNAVVVQAVLSNTDALGTSRFIAVNSTGGNANCQVGITGPSFVPASGLLANEGFLQAGNLTVSLAIISGGGQIRFLTGTNERMTLGTTSTLNIKTPTTNQFPQVRVTEDGGSKAMQAGVANSAVTTSGIVTAGDAFIRALSTRLIISTFNAFEVLFGTDGQEHLRITTGGELLHKTTVQLGGIGTSQILTDTADSTFVQYAIRNTNSAGGSRIVLNNDGTVGTATVQMGILGSAHTPLFGGLVVNEAYLFSGTAAAALAVSSSGNLRLLSGSVERMFFFSGEPTVEIRAATTAQVPRLQIPRDGGATFFLQMGMIGSTGTPFGGLAASDAFIRGVASPIGITTSGTNPIKWLTNSLLRMQVLGNANTLQGNAGLTIQGGALTGNNLTLSSTAFATKGKILFGTSAYDEVNNRLGVGTAVPNARMDVRGVAGASVGGFPSGSLHITSSGAGATDNAVITGHNLFAGNKQLWYIGSTSSSNDNIGIINRQFGTLAFLTDNATRMTILAASNTLQGNAGLKIEGGAGVHVLDLSGGASAASSIAIGIASELIGAFGATPVVRPTGVAVTAAGIHAALVSLGWITA